MKLVRERVAKLKNVTKIKQLNCKAFTFNHNFIDKMLSVHTWKRAVILCLKLCAALGSAKRIS